MIYLFLFWMHKQEKRTSDQTFNLFGLQNMLRQLSNHKLKKKTNYY